MSLKTRLASPSSSLIDKGHCCYMCWAERKLGIGEILAQDQLPRMLGTNWAEVSFFGRILGVSFMDGSNLWG